ncbi:MAG: phosphatidate cytidylyltransferase, partial [Flavobacteriaceae bacterium]|nr:phosphatidate cytidylyltransferase [Flavobacteriaceae bacterium]
MKELLIRAISGLFYATLLLLSLQWQHALTILLLIFGLIVLAEFNKLISMKSWIPFLIFIVLYAIFGYWQTLIPSNDGFNEAVQILHVLTIFVLLILIKDLFSEKPLPSFITGRYINS